MTFCNSPSEACLFADCFLVDISEGVVNIISPDHIGMVTHGAFNVVIPAAVLKGNTIVVVSCFCLTLAQCVCEDEDSSPKNTINSKHEASHRHAQNERSVERLQTAELTHPYCLHSHRKVFL